LGEVPKSFGKIVESDTWSITFLA